jgi:hypothetical protein
MRATAGGVVGPVASPSVAVVVTFEQLLNVHGDGVAITEIERAPCTTPGCIGAKVAPR